MVFITVFLAVLLSAAATYTAVRTQAIETAFPAAGSFVEVDGVRLHYLDQGPRDNGRPTIVVVHGASSNVQDLKLGVSDVLAGEYRVVAFDRPGFGWSDRPSDADVLDPQGQAKILAKAVAKLGIGEHLIVGHSWAGSLILSYALEHPNQLKGVLALAPASHPWPGGIEWYYTLTAMPVIGELFARTIVLPLAEFRMAGGTQSVFKPQIPPEGYVQRAAIPLILRPASFRANAIDVARLYDFVVRQSPRYRDIKVPLTIITGRDDKTVWPTIHSTSLEREVPGARLILLDGVGHMPHYARPDLVKQEIDRLAGTS